MLEAEKSTVEDDERRAQRPYRGIAGVERRSERRARLIDAAIAVFGTEGFRAGTVRTLCAAAQLTERYFYESFASREALLLAAFEQVCASVGQQMLNAADQPQLSPLMRARAVVDVYFTYIETHPAEARVLLNEVLRVSQPMDAVYRVHTQNIGIILLGIFRPHIVFDIELEPLDDSYTAGLAGAIAHLASRWRTAQCRQPRHEIIDVAFALVGAIEGARAAADHKQAAASPNA